jgi:phosphoadenosine phosphosulfate reductase
MSEAATIWRDGGFHADTWVRHAPDAALLAGDYPLLVPLTPFLAELQRFVAHEGALGVEVEAGASVEALTPHLARLTLIALAFPKFSDGRAYSAARLLRERYRYVGELRAIGDVLADQIPLMRRCGITSFAVTHAPTRAAMAAGRLAEVRRFYQPVAATPREVPAGTRPWLRQAAGGA